MFNNVMPGRKCVNLGLAIYNDKLSIQSEWESPDESSQRRIEYPDSSACDRQGAVFSYFLFDKRSQLVEGWKKMAATINQSATEMDKGSGTKVGGELTVAALSHENYADLDAKLAKLTTQSRQLIQAARRAGRNAAQHRHRGPR